MVVVVLHGSALCPRNWIEARSEHGMRISPSARGIRPPPGSEWQMEWVILRARIGHNLEYDISIWGSVVALVFCEGFVGMVQDI